MRRKAMMYVSLCLLLSPFASVPAEECQRTISVAGEGKTTAPPDMATIQTGVVTQAASAREALSANNMTMRKIREVLREKKIAEKDVQTIRFDLRAEYKRDARGRTEPEIVGYRVTNQVEVRVRNLPSLGEVLDALVKVGSNQVSGIRFGIDDLTGVLNQARNRALADAKSRAQLYAQAAGVRVGRVLTISEQPAALPHPRYESTSLVMAGQPSSVPVATGEREIRATVYVVYALEDGA